jgi:hypothetical protein
MKTLIAFLADTTALWSAAVASAQRRRFSRSGRPRSPILYQLAQFVVSPGT